MKQKFSVPGTAREDSRKANDMVRKILLIYFRKKNQGREHLQDRCSKLWTTNLLFASYCTQENNEMYFHKLKTKEVMSVSVSIPCESVHRPEERLTKYLDHSRSESQRI